ncbi:hypothetical protein SynA1562_01742 [Synechococcus sp. A15-62]|nr:hypothetical protein SynA1562_01742 [Synechococcus sp. A15-62]
MEPLNVLSRLSRFRKLGKGQCSSVNPMTLQGSRTNQHKKKKQLRRLASN